MKNGNSNKDFGMLLGIACVIFVLLIVLMSIENTRTTLINILGIRGTFVIGWFSGWPTLTLGSAAMGRWLCPQRPEPGAGAQNTKKLTVHTPMNRISGFLPPLKDCQKELNAELGKYYCVRCSCRKCREEKSRRWM